MRQVRHLLEDKGSAVYSIAPEAPVLDAIRIMAERSVGALPVVRGDALERARLLARHLGHSGELVAQVHQHVGDLAHGAGGVGDAGRAADRRPLGVLHLALMKDGLNDHD